MMHVGQIPTQLLTKCPSHTKSPIVPGSGRDRFRFKVDHTVAEKVCLFGRAAPRPASIRDIGHRTFRHGLKTSLVLIM
jgi:hypothetical protein